MKLCVPHKNTVPDGLDDRNRGGSRFRRGSEGCGHPARNAGVNCSPLRKSTCTVGTVRPFSARKMRTRRGPGAVAQSYNFMKASWLSNDLRLKTGSTAVDCSARLLPTDPSILQRLLWIRFASVRRPLGNGLGL